jgi:hypothetical protein
MKREQLKDCLSTKSGIRSARYRVSWVMMSGLLLLMRMGIRSLRVSIGRFEVLGFYMMIAMVTSYGGE